MSATPMTRDQTTAVLQVAATYDNRDIDDALVNAWHAIAVAARWEYRMALEAVRLHYTDQVKWIMPGHITQHHKSVRSRPAPAAEVVGQIEGPRSTPEGRRAAMDMFIRMLGKEIPA